MDHHSQRLGFSRLADHLADCGKVEPELVQGLYEASRAGGQPLPQALVARHLLSDWDLARGIRERFQLAFVPVDVAMPASHLRSRSSANSLPEPGLVPLPRSRDSVTLLIPGIVGAHRSRSLEAASGLRIQRGVS